VVPWCLHMALEGGQLQRTLREVGAKTYRLWLLDDLEFALDILDTDLAGLVCLRMHCWTTSCQVPVGMEKGTSKKTQQSEVIRSHQVNLGLGMAAVQGEMEADTTAAVAQTTD
jgi:hypothetical protein